MIRSSLALACFLLAHSAAGVCSAQTIDWSGSYAFDQPNAFTSRGDAIPPGDQSDIVWELGVFRDPTTGANWQPTAANLAQWAAHWIPLGQSKLLAIPAGNAFLYGWGGSSSVTSANTNGLRLYIWAHGAIAKLGTTQGECLLFTGDPAVWQAPALGSASPPPILSTANATTVILGRVDTQLDTTGHILESAASHYTSLRAEGGFEVQLSSWPAAFTLTTQPQARSVDAGQEVTFTVQASPSGSYTYQWRLNGVALSDGPEISGSTSSELRLLADVPRAGNYTCLVSDGSDSVPSSAATLTVRPVPVLRVPDIPTDWRVGGAWNYPIQTSNGVSRWTVTGLPPGVRFDPATATLTGRVLAPGTHTLRISATNATGASLVWERSLQVLPLLAETTGTFAGLLPRHPSLGDTLGGSITLSIHPVTGAYTGSLLLGQTKIPFKGRLNTSFDGSATTSTSIPRRGLPPLMLQWNQDLSTTTPMTGFLSTLVAGVEVRLPWSAVRNPWSRSTPATAFAARYHLILEPPPPSAGSLPRTDLPEGKGYLALTASALSGRVSISGRLADGSPATGAAFLSGIGTLPLHLRSAGPASLLAWLSVQPNVPASAAAITGTASWLRLPSGRRVPPRAYGSGIAETTLTLTGGRYQPPPPGQTALTLTRALAPNVRFAVTGADLTSAERDAVSLPALLRTASATSNRQLLELPRRGTAENTASLALSLHPTTGLLSGSFRLAQPNPARPSTTWIRPASVHGLILPFRNLAEGFFLVPSLPNPASSPILSGPCLLRPE